MMPESSVDGCDPTQRMQSPLPIARFQRDGETRHEANRALLLLAMR